MTFNINDEMTVRLNDGGRAIYRDFYAETERIMGRPYPVQPDADGHVAMPLWACMRIFGPHLVMGLDLPFDAAITLTRRP